VRPKRFGGTIPCERCGESLDVPGHVVLPCPQCGRSLKIRPKHFGQEVGCLHCGHSFGLSRHMQIPCPSCGSHLRIRPAYIGLHMHCKHCGHAFRAQRSDKPAQETPAAPPVGLAVTVPTVADATPLPNPADQRAAEELAREIRAVGAARDQLRKELWATRAELESHVARAAALEPLAAERDSLRTERDRLAAAGATAAQEQERLLDRIAQLERALAQAETEGAALQRHGTQARAEWQAERQTLEARLHALEDQQAALRVERQLALRQLDETREQLERLHRTHSDQAERNRAQAEENRQRHEAALYEIETLRQDAQQTAQAWDAERQALRAGREPEHQAQLRMLEQRLEVERAEDHASRDRTERELDALREEFTRERCSRIEELERSCSEAAEWRRRHGEVLAQMELVRQEAEQRTQEWSTERAALQREQASQLDDLGQRLEAERKARQEAEEQLGLDHTRFENERRGLADQVVHLSKTVEELRQQWDQAVHRENSLQRQSEQLRQAWDAERTAHEAARCEHQQRAAAELAGLDTQLRAARQAIEEGHEHWRHERGGLEEQLEQLRLREEDLLRQQQQAHDRCQALEQEVRRLSAGWETERQQSEARQREHDARLQSVERERDRVQAKHREELRHWSDTGARLQQEGQTLSEEARALRQQLKTVEYQRDTALGEIRALRQEAAPPRLPSEPELEVARVHEPRGQTIRPTGLDQPAQPQPPTTPLRAPERPTLESRLEALVHEPSAELATRTSAEIEWESLDALRRQLKAPQHSPAVPRRPLRPLSRRVRWLVLYLLVAALSMGIVVIVWLLRHYLW
jgi:chromosome segregation ATPase